MDSFQCGGWIHITVMDDGDDAFVKLDHKDKHVSYWNIDVPEDVQLFVKNNSELSVTQVCLNNLPLTIRCYFCINELLLFSSGMRS